MRTSIPRDRHSWSLFPRENRDVWNLFTIAAVTIYLTPMALTGWVMVPILLLAIVPLALFFGEPLFALKSIGICFAFFPPLLIFLLWSWPQFDRRELPWRSILLLGLLLVFIPIQLLLQDNLLNDRTTERIREIDTALPSMGIVRHVDKCALLVLTAWAGLTRRSITPKAQVVFHWILFSSLFWAINSVIDPSFSRLIYR